MCHHESSCPEATSDAPVHRLLAVGRAGRGRHERQRLDVTGPIGELIRRRTPIDAARLADPDVPLEDLVGTPHAKR